MTTLDPMERGRGRRLRELRETAGLSQREVGAAFGIDKASVSAWEQGGGIERERLPVLDEMYNADGEVLQLFGVSRRSPQPLPSGGPARQLLDRLRAEVDRLDGEIEQLSARLDALERRPSNGEPPDAASSE